MSSTPKASRSLYKRLSINPDFDIPKLPSPAVKPFHVDPVARTTADFEGVTDDVEDHLRLERVRKKSHVHHLSQERMRKENLQRHLKGSYDFNPIAYASHPRPQYNSENDQDYSDTENYYTEPESVVKQYVWTCDPEEERRIELECAGRWVYVKCRGRVEVEWVYDRDFSREMMVYDETFRESGEIAVFELGEEGKLVPANESEDEDGDDDGVGVDVYEVE